MKILTAFKAVPDPDGDPRAAAAAANARWVINYFDAIALEEAVRLRERGAAAQVVAVTIGPPRVEEQVRAALAMGADRAVRVDDERPVDPYFVAQVLQAVVQREAPGLVILGKQAVDDDSNQVGQMLAGRLGWPQATFVSRLELSDGGARARCTRETDAGLQVVEVRLPAVITTDLRLNEPRYVSLPALIKARRQAIELLSVAQLSPAARPRTRVLRTEPAASRPPGTRVTSVAELVTRLREEAKVL